MPLLTRLVLNLLTGEIIEALFLMKVLLDKVIFSAELMKRAPPY